MDLVNFTRNNTESETIPASEGLYTFVKVVILAVMAVGIPGNIITIVVVYKSKSLHTAGNAMLVNLSVSDLLYFSVVLPIRFATFYNGTWGLSDDYCRVFGAIGHYLVGVSVFNLGGIALTRFMHVIFTSHYKRFYTRRSVAIQIATMWLALFVLIVVLPVSQVWGAYNFNQDVLSCTFHPTFNTGYKIFVLTAGFGLPFVMIIICYVSIFIYVRTSQKKVQEWSLRRMVINLKSEDGEKNQVTPIECRENPIAVEMELQRGKDINEDLNLDSVTSTSSDDKHILLTDSSSRKKRERCSKAEIPNIPLQDESSSNVFIGPSHGKAVAEENEETPKEKSEETARTKKISTVSTTSIYLEGSTGPHSEDTSIHITRNDLFTVRLSSSSSSKSSADELAPNYQGSGLGDTEGATTTNKQRRKSSVRFDLSQRSNKVVERKRTGSDSSIASTTSNRSVLRNRLSDIREEVSSPRSSKSRQTSHSKHSVDEHSTHEVHSIERPHLTLAAKHNPLWEKHQKEAFRMTLMMSVTFLVFLISTFPYIIANLDLYYRKNFPTIYLTTLMITFLNGSLNPFIYALMSSQFRASYTKLLCGRPCHCCYEH